VPCVLLGPVAAFSQDAQFINNVAGARVAPGKVSVCALPSNTARAV